MADIREGLAANLAAISGCQISAYMLSSPTPPCLQVMGPDEIEYDTEGFQRGGDTTFMIVQGFVGFVSDKGAQIVLDEWLASSGDTSVKTAIESRDDGRRVTFGGVVDDARVTRASGYRLYTLPTSQQSNDVIGAEWQIQIISSA